MTTDNNQIAPPSNENHQSGGKILCTYFKTQFGGFFTTFVVITFIGLMLGSSNKILSGQANAVIGEFLAFRSITILIPIELFLYSFALLFSSFKCCKFITSFFLKSFAELIAGLSLVAVATIFGVAAAALLHGEKVIAASLIANSFPLIISAILALLIPASISVSFLVDKSKRSITFFSIYLMITSVIILASAYKPIVEECARCVQKKDETNLNYENKISIENNLFINRSLNLPRHSNYNINQSDSI